MLGPRLTRGRAGASCAGVARGTSSGMRLASGSGPEDGLVVFGMVPEIYNWGSSPEGVWLVLSGDCEVRSPRTAKCEDKHKISPLQGPSVRNVFRAFVPTLAIGCAYPGGVRHSACYREELRSGFYSKHMRDCVWVCVCVCGACLPGRQGCP